MKFFQTVMIVSAMSSSMAQSYYPYRFKIAPKSSEPIKDTTEPTKDTCNKQLLLSAGQINTCAILEEDGSIACWVRAGAANVAKGTPQIPIEDLGDHLAQLGDQLASLGDQLASSVNTDSTKVDSVNVQNEFPKNLDLGDRAVAISLSKRGLNFRPASNHACALLIDGTVKCWGDNQYGQTGGPSAKTYSESGSASSIDKKVNEWHQGHISNTPYKVEYLGEKATAISVGGWHTCALLESGTVKCWGDNQFLQFGEGSEGMTYSEIPKKIQLEKNAKAISAGATHTCAILEDKSIECWGGEKPSSVDESLTELEHILAWSIIGVQTAPTKADSCTPITDQDKCKIAVKEALKDFELASGKSIDWSAIKTVGGGTLHSSLPYGCVFHQKSDCSTDPCDMCSDGNENDCWEILVNQQKSYTPKSCSDTAKCIVNCQSSLPNNAKAISAGGAHTCALLDDGSVQCWGDNGQGQISGIKAELSRNHIMTFGVRKATAISAGSSGTCALLDDEEVVCWGSPTFDHTYQDFIFGADSLPESIKELDKQYNSLMNKIKRKKAGADSSKLAELAALIDNGGSYAASTARFFNIPRLGGKGAAVSVGESHSCALLSTGIVKCWGWNNVNELIAPDFSTSAFMYESDSVGCFVRRDIPEYDDIMMDNYETPYEESRDRYFLALEELEKVAPAYKASRDAFVRGTLVYVETATGDVPHLDDSRRLISQVHKNDGLSLHPLEKAYSVYISMSKKYKVAAEEVRKAADIYDARQEALVSMTKGLSQTLESGDFEFGNLLDGSTDSVRDLIKGEAPDLPSIDELGSKFRRLAASKDSLSELQRSYWNSQSSEEKFNIVERIQNVLRPPVKKMLRSIHRSQFRFTSEFIPLSEHKLLKSHRGQLAQHLSTKEVASLVVLQHQYWKTEKSEVKYKTAHSIEQLILR